MITKDLRKNPKYLAYIRTLPCVICGCKAVPHHEAFGTGGMRLKGPDTWTIPLCLGCHKERTDSSRDRFWNGRNKDPKLIILELMTRYIHMKREAI